MTARERAEYKEIVGELATARKKVDKLIAEAEG